VGAWLAPPRPKTASASVRVSSSFGTNFSSISGAYFELIRVAWGNTDNVCNVISGVYWLKSNLSSESSSSSLLRTRLKLIFCINLIMKPLTYFHGYRTLKMMPFSWIQYSWMVCKVKPATSEIVLEIDRNHYISQRADSSSKYNFILLNPEVLTWRSFADLQFGVLLTLDYNNYKIMIKNQK